MTMSSETEFTGKRALVTGGTRGIGEAIVGVPVVLEQKTSLLWK